MKPKTIIYRLLAIYSLLILAAAPAAYATSCPGWNYCKDRPKETCATNVPTCNFFYSNCTKCGWDDKAGQCVDTGVDIGVCPT